MESSPSNSASSSSPSPSFSSSSVNNNGNNTINTSDVTWRGMNLPFRLRSPLSLMLEYSGMMSSNREDSAPVAGASPPQLRPRPQVQSGSGSGCSGTGEVAIRIIGAGEQENNGVGLGSAAAASSSSSSSISPPIHMSELGTLGCDGMIGGNRSGVPRLNLNDPETRRLILLDQPVREVPISEVYGQRYDIQQAAKWMEQLLPFSLLLLVVFIRQHLQGTATTASAYALGLFVSDV